MTLTTGDKVPEFNLPISEEKSISSLDFKGEKLVLYFYPKDNTPGCTNEAKDFRDNHQKFKDKKVSIIGISKDSLKTHETFAEKFNINFPLASDENNEVCEAFNVWAEKNMFGKSYMGIERSTFLINKEGIITKIWRKVKVSGHVEEVLTYL